jgi:sugar lactone lactonase YvrE
LERVAEGLSWPESPRWRDGCLWISDVHNFRLTRLVGHVLETVARVPGRPAGMGFLPDGRLLLASALDKKLLWVGDDGVLSEAADLSALSKSLLNDMAVDATGRAWVGDTGFAFGSGEPQKPGALIVFDEKSGARPAATNIKFPNGMAISPDQRTLYLAETFGNVISAFDIDEHGALVNRRVHVTLPSSPDGLCLDIEGHLWVPLLFDGEFHRISPFGEVSDRVSFAGKRAIACAFGGDDRRTLFLCVSEVDDSDPAHIKRRGEIYARRCEAAGAGFP